MDTGLRGITMNKNQNKILDLLEDFLLHTTGGEDRLIETSYDMLVEAAQNGNIIATNDKDLLYRLKKLNLNALKIREKNKLIPTEGN